MAVDEARDPPENPDDLLPEDAVLDLEDYLDMHAAIGQPIRYRILYRLVHVGEATPTELEREIDVTDSNLHYHLNELLDVGLVEKRASTERGSDGTTVYYRPTVFGNVTLTDGVDELIRGEGTFEELYRDE
jgi:DNA-binding transcriptional ArsR family regulator